jgi:hypothetical protein
MMYMGTTTLLLPQTVDSLHIVLMLGSLVLHVPYRVLRLLTILLRLRRPSYVMFWINPHTDPEVRNIFYMSRVRPLWTTRLLLSLVFLCFLHGIHE